MSQPQFHHAPEVGYTGRSQHQLNHIPSSLKSDVESANDVRLAEVPDVSRKLEIPSLLQLLQQKSDVDGIQQQLSTIAQLLQRQQYVAGYPSALPVQDQDLHEEEFADRGENQQPQPRRQRKRVCKNASCTFCSSPPCGACEACLHPARRQKCVRR
jgi:hypothetical protein